MSLAQIQTGTLSAAPGAIAGPAFGRLVRRAAVSLATALLVVPLAVQAQKGPEVPAEETFKPQSGQAGKDVIWVPTPDELVNAMLDMATVKAGDKVVDLGSGDGKIAIAAAKRGADALGIEYNPDMVGLSQRNAARAGVTNVRFIQGDIFKTDFTSADVVTMYLLPGLNLKLRPTLLDMKPGTRVASHQFTMDDWEPDESRSISGRDALFWVVPAKIGGTWTVAYPGTDAADLKLELKQTYQKIDASATWGRAAANVSDVKLTGGDFSFAVADPKGGVHRFAAKAGHDGKMSGTVTDPAGRQQSFTASR